MAYIEDNMTRDILKLVQDYISYDPETGKLFWLPRPPSLFANKGRWSAWNKTFAGREAMTTTGNEGYKKGSAFGASLLAHRVAWAIHTGAWPTGEIDHINGIRTDNRISNMRDVGRTANGKNIRRSARNTSGRIGVSYNKLQRRWVAYIKADGVFRFLGAHKSFDDAVKARESAEMEFNFHPNHGRP